MNEKCCKLCEGIGNHCLIDSGTSSGMDFCHCHASKEGLGWEARLGKILPYNMEEFKISHLDAIYDFVRNERKSLIEKAAVEIEGMKHKYKGDGLNARREDLYPEAISDAATLIRKMK